MLGGILAIGRIDCSDKLGVRTHLFAHTHVLASDRAVRHGTATATRYGSRGSNAHSAVDDREYRLEQFNVADCFADEIFNLERKTKMQHVHRPDVSHRRSNIDSNGVVML